MVLECSENQLTTLDVSGCASLVGLACADNQIVELDLSGCPQLERFACANNRLGTLDLSGCPNLFYLDCSGNGIGDLRLCEGGALAMIACSGNQLSSLDLSAVPALEVLDCADNRLEGLDVSPCPGLMALACSNNRIADVSALLAWADEEGHHALDDFTVQDVEPVDPDEPTDPDQPVNPDDPTDPEEPVDPDEPADPDGPGDSDQPADPEQPTDPDEPGDSGETPGGEAEDGQAGQEGGGEGQQAGTQGGSQQAIPQTGDASAAPTLLGLVGAALTSLGAAALALLRRRVDIAPRVTADNLRPSHGLAAGAAYAAERATPRLGRSPCGMPEVEALRPRIYADFTCAFEDQGLRWGNLTTLPANPYADDPRDSPSLHVFMAPARMRAPTAQGRPLDLTIVVRPTLVTAGWRGPRGPSSAKTRRVPCRFCRMPWIAGRWSRRRARRGLSLSLALRWLMLTRRRQVPTSLGTPNTTSSWLAMGWREVRRRAMPPMRARACC